MYRKASPAHNLVRKKDILLGRGELTVLCGQNAVHEGTNQQMRAHSHTAVLCAVQGKCGTEEGVSNGAGKPTWTMWLKKSVSGKETLKPRLGWGRAWEWGWRPSTEAGREEKARATQRQ